jgi:hypothetical protein
LLLFALFASSLKPLGRKICQRCVGQNDRFLFDSKNSQNIPGSIENKK